MLFINKQIGETPLQALDRLRKEKPELIKETLSYIGRLDPMAEGLLLVLVGEENKDREKYLNLDKKYEFEILFGFETDTYDLLGLAKEDLLQGAAVLSPLLSIHSSPTRRGSRSLQELIPQHLVESFIGKFSQPYPPFSSKPVNGKPLWQWAREGRLGEIEIPAHDIEIFGLDYLGEREISKKDLIKTIEENISKVTGNFRQKEIIDSWKKAIDACGDINGQEANFALAKFAVHCSTGTYVRQLVQEIGKQVGQKATTFSLKRLEMGVYKI